MRARLTGSPSVQRFGSAANLNVHLHCLVLDAVYRRDTDGLPSFLEVSAPSDDALRGLLQTIITRLMKRLTRRGVRVEGMGQTDVAESDADGDEARTLQLLHAAAIADRIKPSCLAQAPHRQPTRPRRRAFEGLRSAA